MAPRAKRPRPNSPNYPIQETLFERLAIVAGVSHSSRIGRLFAALVVLVIAATACAATPTIAATQTLSRDAVPVAIEPTPEPAPLHDVTDDRIDFNLTRNDVNCSQAWLSGPDTTVLSAHYVVDGKLGARCFGRTSAVLVDAWKMTAHITPPRHLTELGLFVGYTNTEEIDSSDSYVAYASELGWRANAATISVDLDFAFEREGQLVLTMIHEIGHVVTMARSEAARLQPGSSCLTFQRHDTCFFPHAMMTDWVTTFWTDAQLAQIDPEAKPTESTGLARCENDDGFWNSYSASTPIEDVAEAYSLYVIGYEPTTPGQQARHDWFAKQPEFREARERAQLLGHDSYQDNRRRRCNA